MDTIKPWYQSKTIWGALIAGLASLAKLSGHSVSLADQQELADLAVTLAGAAGAALAIYGRVTARGSIAPGGS